MKITIAKLFEMGGLPENLQKIEPLVAFINGAVDQLVKALQGRLTLRDNVYCEIREMTFTGTGNTARLQTFTPAQRTVEGVLLLQTESKDGNTIGSWTYRFLASGALEVSIYPRAVSDLPITAKFAVLFQ